MRSPKNFFLSFSLFVSFLAFLCCLSTTRSWDINLFSLTVAILSVLVTALIGFQILNYFSIVDRLKSLEEKQQDSERKMKEMEESLSKGFEKEHLFAQASTIASSVTEEHLDLMKEQCEDINSFAKVYLGFANAVHLFMKSGYTENIMHHLTNMRKALIMSEEIIAKTHPVLPDAFNQLCNEKYAESVEFFSVLTPQQIDYLHQVRELRKKIFLDK